MRKCLFSVALLFLSIWATARENPAAQQWLGKNGVSFTENKGQIMDTRGQARPDVLYYAEANGVKLYFRSNAISYVFPKVEERAGETVTTGLYRMDLELVGANPNTKVVSENQVEGLSNFYQANASNGVLGVKSYSKITYKNVYNNIDLVFYTVEGGAVKYDFVVMPGGNPNDIRLRHVDAGKVTLNPNGTLEAVNPMGRLLEEAPFTFQVDAKNARSKTEIASRYVYNNGVLSFNVGDYDKSRTLVIDPLTRQWATFYGAPGLDRAFGVTTDGSGNVTITGITQNNGFPVSTGAFQTTFAGVQDAFVVQFDATGQRKWATFYGGASIDEAYGVRADGSGNVVVCGYTASNDFPVSANGGTNSGGGDVFVLKFSSAGVRSWGVLFGGNSTDRAFALDVDDAGNIAVAGVTSSSNFPVTIAGTLSGVRDAFVARLTPTGTRQWATFYGGAAEDQANGVAINKSSGAITVVGQTTSTNLPGATGANGGLNDAFTAGFSSAGARTWAAYFGGSQDDQANGVAVDGSGNIAVVGSTLSTGLATAGAFQSTNGGQRDAFVVKYNSGGTRQWSTYFGGSGAEEGTNVAIGANNSVVFVGLTASTNFPASADAQQAALSSGNDAYVAKLDGASGSRQYATYYGGAGNDFARGIATGNGNIYISGQTSSANFPTQNPFQANRAGNDDAFALVFKDDAVACTAISINDDSTNPSSGSNNGAISISVTPTNAGPFSYAWTGPNSFTSNSQNISGLAAGTYNLTVSYGAGCSESASYVLTTITGFTVSLASQTNVKCFGGSTGAIDIDVQGGQTPYTYQWSGPNGFTSASQDLSGLKAGSYTGIVTDAAGASQSATIVISQPSELNATVDAIVNPNPEGSATGAIQITVTGGVPPYTYLWTPGNRTTQDISGLMAGDYTGVVTDDNGCVLTAGPISVGATCPTFQAISTDIACFGLTDGKVTVTAAGGASDLDIRYSLDGGPLQTNNTFLGLTKGDHTVTVSVLDDSSCNDQLTFTIDEPGKLEVESVSRNNPACNGGLGSITVNTTGGTGQVTLSYDGGNTFSSTNTINVHAGSYDLIVKDVNNCRTSWDGIVITEPPVLFATISDVVNVQCNGQANGSFIVSASGGNAPYQYAIVSGPQQRPYQSIGEFENLPAGNYTVNIRDVNGCVISRSTSIGQPQQVIDITVIFKRDATCFNSEDGTITVNATGGTLPYLYTIDGTNYQPERLFNGLGVGNYSITVMDANGCTATVNTFVGGSPAIIATAVSILEVACNGGSTGAIDMSVSGGVAPYTYLWSNDATTEDVSGLAAGPATVMITDAAGCTLEKTFIVDEASTLEVVTNIKRNVSCNAMMDGKIDISITGGLAPYSYRWTSDMFSGIRTTQDLNNLGAGVYNLQVTDANGCKTFAVFTITQPEELVAAIAAINAVSCHEGSDGSIVISVDGGTEPYSYLWSTNATTQNVDGLMAGVYSVNVTDANGCESNISAALVTQPDPVVVDLTVTDASCFGYADGKVMVDNAMGGTAPYMYSLDGLNFTSSSLFTGLMAGDYTLYVRDGHGCGDRFEFMVGQPNEILLTTVFKADIACFGLTDGKVTIVASGGTASNMGYQYSMDASPFTDFNSFDGLTKGNHVISVKDMGNGCVQNFNENIVEPPLLQILNTTVSNESCTGEATATVFVTTTGGTTWDAAGNYSPIWYSTDGGATFSYNAALLENIAPGDYTIIARDRNNCMATSPAVSHVAAALGAEFDVTNVECFGASTGVIHAMGMGGGTQYTVSYEYAMGDGEWMTSGMFGGLAAGTYTVHVRDNKGCVYSQDVTVSQNPSFMPGIMATPADVVCEEVTMLTATTNLEEGTALSYQWLDADGNAIAGETGMTFMPQSGGFYWVDITNANTGCTERTEPFFVNPRPNVNIVTNVEGAPLEFCEGSFVVLRAVSDIPGINYNWYLNGTFVKGGVDPLYTAFETGMYTVEVTTAPGCVRTSEAVMVKRNARPVANVFPPAKTVICPGVPVTLESSRAIGWSYQWYIVGSPDMPVGTNNFMYNATAAGMYYIIITNATTGCADTSNMVTLTKNNLSFTAAITEPSGCGLSDGQISLTASNAIGATSFSVNNGGWVSMTNDMGTVTGLSRGMYALSVRDGECQVSQNVELTVKVAQISQIIAKTHNRMDVAWTPVTNARYNVQYRVVGDDTWTTIENLPNDTRAFVGAPIPSVRIPGLQHQTNYEIRVQSYCTDGTMAEWSNTVDAMTNTQPNGRCFMPANIYVNMLPGSITNALVYWTVPTGGELNPVCYDLEFRPLGSTTWTAYRINETFIPFLLENLLSSTTYELRIRTNCVTCPSSGNRLSTYSPIILFDTPNDCPDPLALVLNGGMAADTVCGETTLMIDNLTPAGNIVYMWERSTNNGASWSAAPGNHTNPTYIARRDGWYRVTVKVGNCDAIVVPSIRITVNAIPGVVSNIISNVSCFGGNNGALLAGCTGDNNLCLDENGNADYEFSLDGVNYQSNGLFTDLMVGTYTVYVRKISTGCSSTFSHPVFTTITGPSLPEVTQLAWPGAANIDVTFTQVLNAAGYRIAYRIEGSGEQDWKYVTVNQPFDANNPGPITVRLSEGIQRNGSIYEVRIQTRCAFDQSLNEFSPSKTVVVDPQNPDAGCVIPGGVFMSHLTTTSAQVNWQPTANATSYIVEWRDAGATNAPFMSMEVTDTTSYMITGLEPGVEYFARVRAKCGEGNFSNISALISFFTSLNRDQAASKAEATIFSVYPNPNKGTFAISFNAETNEATSVRIIDMSGRTVYTKEFQTNSGVNELPINIENAASGIYNVELKQGSVLRTTKVHIN